MIVNIDIYLWAFILPVLCVCVCVCVCVWTHMSFGGHSLLSTSWLYGTSPMHIPLHATVVYSQHSILKGHISICCLLPSKLLHWHTQLWCSVFWITWLQNFDFKLRGTCIWNHNNILCVVWTSWYRSPFLPSQSVKI